MPISDPLKLHVERSGSGPALILAHGFGGSARNFRPQARAFSAKRSVVLFDARGHARSPAPRDAAAYTEAALVSDLSDLVESAGPAPVVGGLSLGAYTALAWALGSETPPAGLVLAAFPSTSEKARRWSLDFADAIAREGLERAGERYVWGEASRFDAKAAALIRQGFLEHPPHAIDAILRNVLSQLSAPENRADLLRAFSTPVLLIAGEKDSSAVDASERLAQLLPDATVVIVPEAGHVVNLADPERFNAALDTFLTRVGRLDS